MDELTNIAGMSNAEKTRVRAFLILVWKQIFALRETLETRQALDDIEDLMSALDSSVTENEIAIDLRDSPILVEDASDAVRTLRTLLDCLEPTKGRN